VSGLEIYGAGEQREALMDREESQVQNKLQKASKYRSEAKVTQLEYIIWVQPLPPQLVQKIDFKANERKSTLAFSISLFHLSHTFYILKKNSF